MIKDTPTRFSRTTLVLHWFVAFGVIGLIGVGLYMAENDAYTLYPLHKSVGMLMLLVILPRVVWRTINGWPQPVGTHRTWERTLARAVHWVLILGTLLMPLSGMLMSAAGGHGLSIFGWELLAANPDPAHPGKVIALNKAAAGFGHEAHELLASVLIGAIVLHVAGALKHHLVDRDGTLRRMLGKAV